MDTAARIRRASTGGHAGRIRPVRLLCLALPAILAGCSATVEQPPAPRGAPILLVGIDGLEWSVALPLVREGRMPHLEGLMRRGTFGRLETLAPGKSPVIWTTIATGKRPAEHGILDFTFVGNDGRKRLYGSAHRRTKALWNILSDRDRRSIFISWWNTFPVEEIDGVVVAQANTLAQIARRRMLKPGGMLRGVAGQVHPAARQDEMLAITAQADQEMALILRGIFGEIGREQGPGERAILDACAWAVRSDEATRRIALRLAAESPQPDLFAVYLGLPDVVSHRFWRFHEPERFEHPPPAEALRRFGNVVRDAYVHTDAVIGELLEALPRTGTVLIVSDHGFHAHNTSTRFDVREEGRLELESGDHEDGPPGIFVAAGPAIRRARPEVPVRELTETDLLVIGHVLDMTPTLLALLDIPVGRDMSGEVLDRVLEESYVREHPVDRVETHDGAKWLAGRGGEAPDAPGLEERLEQLRSLGYIERTESGGTD